ncbi:MAG TPA: efflux transporter outer membrane subunit [Acidobacteriaceae bacterium]|nr:efflux transporter outer membrane subunit [Acidobacteriaceae bacterium]
MHRSVSWKIATNAMVAVTLMLPQACTVGPNYHPPAPPAITAYTPQAQPPVTASGPGAAGESQQLHGSSDLPAQWWALFQSPQLDGMVREALSNSPTLAAATARLTQARQEVRARVGATKYPAVSGNASVAGQQLDLAAYGIPFPNPSPFALLNGSIGITYALDLFGGNRRLIESLRAQADYQQWQLEGARLILAGNVVAAAVRQAQLRAQLDITEQMIQVRQTELRITEARRRAGGVSDSDLRAQRLLLAQTEAALPPIRQQLEIASVQLAVLMGRPPAQAPFPGIAFDSLKLPAQLPLSLPSSLVRQRPDIRAAESLLHQASAGVGVATANRYPQITISASAGALGTSFITGGDIWNVAAGLAQPLYNGGALKAEQRKAQAAYDEANSEYRQTVIEAFQQVADTLYAIQNDAQTFQSRTAAAEQAEAAYQIDVQRYQAGGISRLALLEAQRQQLQTALDRSSSAENRYLDSATLFQALGGGWWNR